MLALRVGRLCLCSRGYIGGCECQGYLSFRPFWTFFFLLLPESRHHYYTWNRKRTLIPWNVVPASLSLAFLFCNAGRIDNDEPLNAAVCRNGRCVSSTAVFPVPTQYGIGRLPVRYRSHIPCLSWLMLGK